MFVLKFQDDLLMDEDQAEIDLCLGNVDIEDTKQMFQVSHKTGKRS